MLTSEQPLTRRPPGLQLCAYALELIGEICPGRSPDLALFFGGYGVAQGHIRLIGG